MSETQPVLTTQRHWQRPDQLQIRREQGWAYRYFKKPDVERRIDEGWEIVASKLKERNEGGPVERAQHYRGLILMRMPQHMADERNQYYIDKHNKRVRAVARGAHFTSMAKAATHAGGNEGGDLAGVIGKGLVMRTGSVEADGTVHSHTEVINLSSHPDDLAEDAQLMSEVTEKKESSHALKGESPRDKKPGKTGGK